MEGQWGGEVEEDAADARRDTLHAIPLNGCPPDKAGQHIAATPWYNPGF